MKQKQSLQAALGRAALSAYFRTLGSAGGKAGSREAKRKAGKLGARVRWAKGNGAK